jgi:hypothetical protein
LTIAQKGG